MSFWLNFPYESDPFDLRTCTRYYAQALGVYILNTARWRYVPICPPARVNRYNWFCLHLHLYRPTMFFFRRHHSTISYLQYISSRIHYQCRRHGTRRHGVTFLFTKNTVIGLLLCDTCIAHVSYNRLLSDAEHATRITNL